MTVQSVVQCFKYFTNESYVSFDRSDIIYWPRMTSADLDWPRQWPSLVNVNLWCKIQDTSSLPILIFLKCTSFIFCKSTRIWKFYWRFENPQCSHFWLTINDSLKIYNVFIQYLYRTVVRSAALNPPICKCMIHISRSNFWS